MKKFFAVAVMLAAILFANLQPSAATAKEKGKMANMKSEWKAAPKGAWEGANMTWYKLDKNAKLWMSKDGKKWMAASGGMWQDKDGKWLKIGDGKLWWSADGGKNWSEVPEWKWEGADGKWYKFDSKWKLWVHK